MFRRAGSLLDHIPLQLHPPVRALAITLFMVTVNLGYAWLIRRALAALFASATFVDQAEKHGASRALLSALWRGRDGRSRVRHAAILIAGAVGYGFGTLVVAGYILQLATLEHTAHGFTKTHLQPLLARLLVAGYLIGPTVMLYIAATAALAGRVTLSGSPLGWRGWRWISAQDRMRQRQMPIRSAVTTFRSRTFSWPTPPFDPQVARAAAIRAYRPLLGSVTPSVLFAVFVSTAWFAQARVPHPNEAAAGETILLLSVGVLFSDFFVPLDVRAQTCLLWCLRYNAPAVAGALQDPLGALRAGLGQARRLLLAQARRLERQQWALGVLPVPLTLRAVSRDIAEFSGSRRSLRGELPQDLRQTLEMTAAFLAGGSDAGAIKSLSRRARAYDKTTGNPRSDLVPPRHPIRHLPDLLASTAQLLRNTALSILIVGVDSVVGPGQDRVHRNLGTV